MELKKVFRSLFLSLTLLIAATPGWCAKDTVTSAKAVNINTADAGALADGLVGVGQSKAEAIIAYRKQHGPFKSPEQLAEVKGIGDKLMQKNHDRVTVK